MKILVFSDSHGDYRKLKKAAEMHADADMYIFLGDGLRDAERLFDENKKAISVAVKGNCDITGVGFSDGYLEEQTLDIEGVRIFCCHGHKYSVKFSLMNLAYRAREKEVNIALFGHTHTPIESVNDGIRFFNPGSVREGNYGIIYIEKGAVVASHAKI